MASEAPNPQDLAPGRLCRPLLREAGKVPRRGGWGVETRYAPTLVRADGRASRLGLKKRAIPHPALRATFPSKLGKGCARRFGMCACRRAKLGKEGPAFEMCECSRAKPGKDTALQLKMCGCCRFLPGRRRVSPARNFPVLCQRPPVISLLWTNFFPVIVLFRAGRFWRKPLRYTVFI